MEWLDERNIDYSLLNVTGDAEARNEMRDLTGQGKAPSIDVNGEILADFGADELGAWWEEKGFPVGEK
jgi:monothiol glutaredoxin